MTLAIAQIDSLIGAFEANSEKIITRTKEAAQRGARAIFFPEFSLCGYPPLDLLDQASFTEQNLRALRSLQQRLPQDILVGVGHVDVASISGGKPLVNSYSLLLNGQRVFSQEKTLLPSYDVFDESRYFEAARERRVFEWEGQRLGIAICEDLWWDVESRPGARYSVDPVRELLDLGASLLLVPSASPYYAGKAEIRWKLSSDVVRRGNVPLLYINACGANDSLVFDGRSFMMALDDAATGTARAPAQRAAAFDEDLLLVEPFSGAASLASAEPTPRAPASTPLKPAAPVPLYADELDCIEDALVAGIRGYMKKCGFSRAHLGLSGGIDSALCAWLTVRAVGPENVSGYGMPSRYSSDGSRDDAQQLAENLGIHFELLPIEQVFGAALDTLSGAFGGKPFDLAEENMQARIRGLFMMAISNKHNSMLISTGNKSELAMGYCTLYGDMCGALAPIGDLFKTEVFALCRRINERHEKAGQIAPIPWATVTKPPSAELRPDQKDEDSLPPYEQLDAILKLYVLDDLSAEEIVRQGWPEDVVRRVVRTTARAEFKRRQAAPLIKVSPRAFGMGRRIPIARDLHDD